MMNRLRTVRVIILSLCALISLMISGYIAYRIYQETLRQRNASDIVNTETNTDIQVKINLGSFEPLKGTPYLMAAVSSQQNYRQSYYEKEASSTRNFLFFHVNDKSSWKLIPNNNFLFLRHEKLSLSTPAGDVPKNVGGLWYEVVKADSDGDKRLTNEDRKTIAFSDISGKNYTEIIPQVDKVLGTHQINDSTLLFFYTSGAEHFVTEINIPVRQAVVTRQLPPLQ